MYHTLHIEHDMYPICIMYLYIIGLERLYICFLKETSLKDMYLFNLWDLIENLSG